MTTELILISILLFIMALTLYVNHRSERGYQRLSVLNPSPQPPPQTSWRGGGDAGGSPSVAVIIPARNEQDVIERVVRSVRALADSNAILTVVDDGSTDDTARLAREAGAAVITLRDGPPLGWTGKTNACHQAASRAEAEWLLFTDADTCHAPDSLHRAVAYATAHSLDALSLLLRQECQTLPEKLVLPLAYQHFFASLHPDRPALNGQYILIRRAVYEASGGFSAVRGQVMEDVALGEHLTTQGYRIALLNGHEAASVRMYRTFAALLEGMTKTTFATARDQGRAGVLLALPFFLGVWVLPIGGLGVLLNAPLVTGLALLCVLLTALGLRAWLRRFGVRLVWWYALLNPAGVAILWGVGLVATYRAVFRRGVRWKGRVIGGA
jgi:chlorobactene glucosyltransferase